MSEKKEVVFGGGEVMEEKIPKYVANQAQECVPISKGSELGALSSHAHGQGGEEGGEQVSKGLTQEHQPVHRDEGLCTEP